ncbi:PDR/VanB family oxidoreductase [Parapusillimonas sp. JC17]|uniref:PDR/VanB family oxidoreductase n=1 Tax=Parapusillimonas sp. JC17 TaxID=3445768 RepID=UPI003F9F507B
MVSSSPLSLRVRSIRAEADGIYSYELVTQGSQPLPAYTAGAHLTLTLPGGMARSYSLANRPDEDDHYLIAVGLDRRGRGGSVFMHTQARVGDVFSTQPPRNNFELANDAKHSTFIAGGIGITPIRSMIARLSAERQSWELHYCVRNRGAAAFLKELESLPNVHLYFDQEQTPTRLDLEALIAKQDADTHIYCCGPKMMLDSFLSHTKSHSPDRIHFERFSAELDAGSLRKQYRVRLARSGQVLDIAPGVTILDAMINAGLSPVHSCAQGICGSCETIVLEGRPDHKDQVLTQAEKASGRRMMICCSGSLDDELVLDL